MLEKRYTVRLSENEQSLIMEEKAEIQSKIITKLSDFLAEDAILSEADELRPYECDGLSAYQQTPLLVLLPSTIEEVQKTMCICTSMGIPVVARGAGTGLSGGALPNEYGIILSLARFNQIIDINTDHFTARVQPGVRNLAISNAASAYGLYYAPDPSSQIACSIGGNVAENSGGVHCLKYGLTLHNVMEITLVTAGGEVFTVGSPALDSPGYDLLSLMTGSEGMLGIIVEVLVKLLPQPDAKQVIMVSFDQVETASEAVSKIISSGITPAGLEMMDKLAIQAAESFAKVGYPTDVAAILLCELDGSQEDVDEQSIIIQQLLTRAGAVGMRIAKSAEEQMQLWQGRKSAFPAVGRISPDYYCMDGTIPRHQLAHVLARINELSEQYGLAVANVFHAGDGNLHPLILYDANQGELPKAEQFGADILTLCVEVGGTITGEHGVGHEKLDQMCVQFSAEELQQFHAVKSSFDPHELLNPGKAIPTLHRCAEFGAMHVHNGKLPHSDIPRF